MTETEHRKPTDRCAHPKNVKRLQELSCNPDDCPYTYEYLLEHMLSGCCYIRDSKKVACNVKEQSGNDTK